MQEKTTRRMNERAAKRGQKPQEGGSATPETDLPAGAHGETGGEPAGHWRLRRRPGGGSPRATAKRPVAPRGSVTPDRKRGDGGRGAPRDAPPGEGREEGPGEETGGRRLGKGGGTGPPFTEVASYPRARGDRLAVTASRPGARTPSRLSPCHCRHISPSTPAPACAWLEPRASVIPADSARSAPHTRTASGSRHLRARARPSPAPRRHAHVTARFQGVDRVFVT